MPFDIAPLPGLFRLLLLVIAGVAGTYDVLYRRIPNWVVLAGLIAGFAAHAYTSGWTGVLTAAEGFGLGFAVYLVFHLLRGMGAGDVKLMGALGCIAGPLHWFVLFVGTALLGGVVAVALALTRGRLYSTLLNVGQLMRELVLLRAPYKQQPQLDMHHVGALRAPHGTIIAVAAVFLMLGRLL
jgi:prepilin peptidase CpaA